MIQTITLDQFLKGSWHLAQPRLGRHTFKARMEGRSIVVEDEDGQPVKVSYAGTTDNRTVTAHVDGLGYIGGWRYPHRRMPWSYLVDSINRGYVYRYDTLPYRPNVFYVVGHETEDPYGPYPTRGTAQAVADALTHALGRDYTVRT